MKRWIARTVSAGFDRPREVSLGLSALEDGGSDVLAHYISGRDWTNDSHGSLYSCNNFGKRVVVKDYLVLILAILVSCIFLQKGCNKRFEARQQRKQQRQEYRQQRREKFIEPDQSNRRFNRRRKKWHKDGSENQTSFCL